MSLPIIICDDSAMARKQLARALPADWPVDITYANNGEEALMALREGKGEVLFLDLTMPVLDGFQTLQQINEEALDTSVIVVSGDIQPDARNRVLGLGALDFVKKPIGSEELAGLLDRFGFLDRARETEAPKPAQAPAQPVERPVNFRVDRYDAYREVVNVAIGRAADLLARLLKVFVVLPVPNVSDLEPGELRMALAAMEQGGSQAAVCQGFVGSGIAGEAMLIFNEGSTADLARLLGYKGKLDEHASVEIYMDVANVLIGACLRGIAEQIDVTFSVDHPTVLGLHRPVSEVVAKNGGRWRNTLTFEIPYRIESCNIDCDLLLLFTEDSVEPLQQRVAHWL
ncbi:MAG: response regulator [Gammaproteobacteria bacterium]|nr:response regulator [Gammaproteobacteria bacterium]